MAAPTETASGPRRWLDRLTGPRRDDGEARLPAGWRVIAAKEFSDHVTSARFLVLLVIIGFSAAVPLYFAAGEIRSAASQLTSAQAVFLALFTFGPEDFGFLRADTFVGLFAPLLGIAFGFDAVNVERSEGTLPRLVSQPIHRDDVINGKFVAGLGVIALVFTSMILIVSGVGIVVLGLVPDLSDVIRLVAWVALTVLYAGFWLALGMLLSVVFHRAATAALIGFGTWVAVVLLGSLFLLQLIAQLVAPINQNASTEAEARDAVRAAQTQSLIRRLSPHTLYRETATVLLVPYDPITAGAFVPASLEELDQARPNQQGFPGRIASLFSIQQSLLIVWPQVVGLVALTTVVFATTYVVFMRQEVRA